MIEYEYSVKDQGYLVLAMCDNCKIREFEIAKRADVKPGMIIENYIDLFFQGWVMDGAKLYCPRCVEELTKPRAQEGDRVQIPTEMSDGKHKATPD